MTAPACGSCTAPVNDGYLCTGCTRELGTALLTAASIAGDLDDAVARLLRRGGGGRSSETSAPLPFDLAASDAATALRGKLFHWVGAILTENEPAPTAPAIEPCAWWLARNVQRLRQHPQAADAHRDIRDAVARAVAVVDRRPERAPAGQCGACQRQLLAELGADEVRCGCGELTVALLGKRRDRAAAADVLGTPAAVSDALAAIGIAVPRGTITSWVSRGRIPLRPGGVVALSDVLAMKAQSSQPRPKVRG